MRYSIELRDQIYFKHYGFLNLLSSTKMSVPDTFKTASKIAIQKIKEATGKVASKSTRQDK